MRGKHYWQMDGLRAVAAAAVVMIHCSSAGGDEQTIPFLCNVLSLFAVPLFILLSGFGHGGEQDLSAPRRLFVRRMKRLLPPYILWSLLYLAVGALFGKPHPRPVWACLTGAAYMHLYFIFVLIQFEILYVPLYRAVRRAPRVTLLVSAVVTLGMQTLLCGQQLALWELPPLPMPYTKLFVPYLLFYVAGLCLRRWDRLPQTGNMPLLAGAAAFWLVSAAAVVWVTRRYPALDAIVLRPDLTVYVFAVFLLLWMLFSLLHGTPRIIREICRLSFALYLSHPLVMRLWNEWTIRQEPVIYLTLWQRYAMALIGGLLIAWVVSELPHGSLLGGAPRKKPC